MLDTLKKICKGIVLEPKIDRKIYTVLFSENKLKDKKDLKFCC